MKPTLKRIAVMAAAGTALAVSNAGAANSFYAPGDLVLFFQRTGDADTVYASLGNTATAFRGAGTGTVGDEGLTQVNFLNINSTLTSAFGAGWATDPSIYAGVAGVWGTSNTNGALQNNDPHRTLYISSPRNTVGTIGSADSTGWDLFAAGNTAMTSGAGGINSLGNAFETTGTLQQEVMDVSLSQIDDQNPFVPATTIQDTAMNGTFAGGVQQVGDAAAFGTISGVGEVQFALDLYRILARSSTGSGTGQTFVTNQIDGPHRVGTFEGTVTIGTNGDVSFLTAAVPEPSTSILAGLAASAFVLRRRRNA